MEVEHVTFSVSMWLKSSWGEVRLCWKPCLNRTSGSKVVAIERFSKQWKTKEINAFFFLAVFHNQFFRLIPLERNTYARKVICVINYIRIVLTFGISTKYLLHIRMSVTPQLLITASERSSRVKLLMKAIVWTAEIFVKVNILCLDPKL